jgi:hypothetical protein
MANIEGKAHVYISFDGRDPNVTSPQGVEYLWAIENSMLIAPVLMLSLYDDGVITNPSPGDGSLIEVQLGKQADRLNSYRFRMIGAPYAALAANGKTVIRYNAVFDSPRLFHETANFALKASSSDVVSAVASELGLTADVDSSISDKMIWHSGIGRWSAFLERVASRGWFGDDSAATNAAIGLDGVLRYYSLARLAKAPVAHTFYHMTPLPEAGSTEAENAHLVYALDRDDSVALTTAQTGYTATTRYFDRSGAIVTHDSVNVTRQTNQLNMSAELRDAIDIGTQRIRPSASPNTHENWDRALYQNTRYRSTYNAAINVLLLDTTQDLTLYTPCALRSTFFATGAQDDALRAVRGLVKARSVGIWNMNYMEKVSIGVQGLDANDPTSAQM